MEIFLLILVIFFSCMFDGNSACWKKTRAPPVQHWVKVKGNFTHVFPNRVLGLTITQILFKPASSSSTPGNQVGLDASPSKRKKFNSSLPSSMGTIQLTTALQLQLHNPGSSNVRNEMCSGSGVTSFLNNPLPIPPSDSEMNPNPFIENLVGNPTTSPSAGPSLKKKGKRKATDLD